MCSRRVCGSLAPQVVEARLQLGVGVAERPAGADRRAPGAAGPPGAPARQRGGGARGGRRGQRARGLREARQLVVELQAQLVQDLRHHGVAVNTQYIKPCKTFTLYKSCNFSEHQIYLSSSSSSPSIASSMDSFIISSFMSIISDCFSNSCNIYWQYY